MTVPGSNLLMEALELIEPQTVQYFQNTGRTKTGAGILIPTLAAAVPVTLCSLQPVPRSKFDVLGLDYSKNYVWWFVPRHTIGIERDASGDQINYGGKLYQVESLTDWEGQDGWLAALCVQIG